MASNGYITRVYMDDCTADWLIASKPPQCVASFINQLDDQQQAIDAINGVK